MPRSSPRSETDLVPGTAGEVNKVDNIPDIANFPGQETLSGERTRRENRK